MKAAARGGDGGGPAIRRICVFCGSSPGEHPAYAEAAAALGALLASEGIGLVTGGGRVGLMGAVADAALRAGGEVIGVIPRQLEAREVAHVGLTDLRIVGSMHERKALMADLSDAFVALPGGLGTFEELFEALTWAQLGIHAKPCALLNVRGYYDGLLRFLDHAVAEGLLRPRHRGLLLTAQSARELLPMLRAYEPPETPAWMGREGR